MRQDQAVWGEIRRLYSKNTLSLTAIAAMHGVSVGRIRRRARAEGWPCRPTRSPAQRRGANEEQPASAPRSKASDAVKGNNDAPRLPGRRNQGQAIARLFRAISSKLEHMERRMVNGEERSAQDEERETRALATMIRNFERVTEAAAEFDRQRPSTAKPDTATRADAERMRGEIAERIERLQERRNPQ